MESCKSSDLFKQAVSDFTLPDGFEIVIEPWPYGPLDYDEPNHRYFQALCFAREARTGNPDANFYSFPLPVIPVMDARTRQIIRVDRPATGGKGEGLTQQTFDRNVIGQCKASDYVPELLPQGTRKDIKELNVVQPEGPSFRVTDESLVEWQKVGAQKKKKKKKYPVLICVVSCFANDILNSGGFGFLSIHARERQFMTFGMMAAVLCIVSA